MKRTLQISLAAALLAGVSLSAQLVVPELAYEAAIEPLKLPANLNFGEVAGVATNSKGDVFVYTRTGHPTLSLGTATPFAHGGSRMFRFDKTGKYVGEIGQGVYAFLFAEKVKVDPQDNIWVVDQMSNTIMEFDPEGRLMMLLGRKAEAEAVPARARHRRGAGGWRRCGWWRGGRRGERAARLRTGAAAGRGGGADPKHRPVAADAVVLRERVDNRTSSTARPTSRGTRQATSTSRTGSAPTRALRSSTRTGSSFARGARPEPRRPVPPAAEHRNRRAGPRLCRRCRQPPHPGVRRRWKPEGRFLNVGTPRAICITSGPRQGMYVSNSNVPEDIDVEGEIYKVDLTGKLLGKFGRAGRLAKEFNGLNQLECRSENELWAAEIGNWRVSKITLRANATN
jgi:hypothetical protein